MRKTDRTQSRYSCPLQRRLVKTYIKYGNRMLSRYRSTPILKRRSFLKKLILVADLITFGRLFQNAGVAAVKLRSPNVRSVFVLGCCSKISRIKTGESQCSFTKVGVISLTAVLIVLSVQYQVLGSPNKILFRQQSS